MLRIPQCIEVFLSLAKIAEACETVRASKALAKILDSLLRFELRFEPRVFSALSEAHFGRKRVHT